MGYEYVKLAVKKDSIPTSADDPESRIINLDLASSEVTVSNLDDSSLYYFVIFSKDMEGRVAQSEPKSATTGQYVLPPATMNSISVNVTTVVTTYSIPQLVDNTYSSITLAIKKDQPPTSASDCDISVSLNAQSTSTTSSNLQENSTYYFAIFTRDVKNHSATSNVLSCTTGFEFTREFDYSGQEEVVEIPVTGVYSLETWGAQGNDAIIGNVNARGGYGSYSYGEMLLHRGDRLYINVGGQNGYNGGGSVEQN